MSRTTWQIQTKVLGGSWTAAGTIYRPNDSLSLVTQSTQTDTQLADGSESCFTPSTKSLSAPLTFIWYADDGTLKTQLEGYITNQTNIKIIDHDSNEYVGRFIGLEVTQIVGVDPDEYDIKVTLKRMASLI
jgi:hypothetical protein